MNADQSSEIAALRTHLGEVRFRRFVAELRGRQGLLLFWQSKVLDELEVERGIVLPRTCERLGSLLLPLLPRPPTLAVEEVPVWLSIEVLEGSAPVQAWGTVTAPHARWYFRSRHESWSVSLSTKDEIDPVDVYASTDGCFHHEEQYGDLAEDASYMPRDVARFFIVRELSRWRGAQAAVDAMLSRE